MNPELTPPKPAFRKLKGYAFDPSLSLRIDTAEINSIIYKIAWEDLKPGPVGEYVEVVDYDPSVKKFYQPVNLEHPHLLAQDGFDPSESNPQFHQQMVYAVTMTTIRNFEKALGRKILWAPRLLERNRPEDKYEEYVERLRIYPHAIRDANAYYSPQKKALLFGYFQASPADQVMHMPDSLVFTCLSHDIIAHEVTHAILDGMNYYYNYPTNPDVLAFHEAFADIVALFQHFTFPDVLKHQIAQTRGDLASQNLLGKLAQEFGAAIGGYGSLRDALGSIDEKTKEWKAAQPDPDEYRTVMEPHHRGSILVAAVFEAFLTIYKRRVADLLRIATSGSGVLPQGELQPDLVNRLANEASKAASHVLSMCIRALDYCPPVDITFGDYLRGIISADLDLVSDDSRDYRLAFIDAFRRRGIYPEGIKTLSEESLRHAPDPRLHPETTSLMKILAEFLQRYRDAVIHVKDRKKIYQITRDYLGGARSIQGLHERIYQKFEDSIEFEKLTGLVFSHDWEEFGLRTTQKKKNKSQGLVRGPSFRVQNMRLVSRVGPKGEQLNQIVFSLIQRAGIVVRNEEIVRVYPPTDGEEPPKGGFEFYCGATLIFDLNTTRLRYAITKPLLDPEALLRNRRELNTRRILAQHRHQFSEGLLAMDEHSLTFGNGLSSAFNEPFAFLHHHD
jgi:hypothetical protein